MLSYNYNQNQPLHFNDIIANQSGYQLRERHVVVYLHSWSISNGEIKTDDECSRVVEQLLEEFKISPASTTLKLENYAKQHYTKLHGVLGDILMQQEVFYAFSDN